MDAAGGEQDLDARIRRLDPDRWLASRFAADAAGRAAMIAVYALNDELARVGETVSQPLAGEIRLAWWRERLEGLAAGETAPSHPVLQTLAPALRSGRLPAMLLDALVEARHADLETAPFADDAALARYLDGTAGAVMALAARALDADAPLRAGVEAARAWGLAGLYRARGHWRARGRSWTPAGWGVLDEAALGARVAEEVEAALARARRELKPLAVTAFPAVAYATLAGPYAHARSPSELERRGRILCAVLRGRI